MLYKFRSFLNEEINIEIMEEKSLDSIKRKLVFRLSEYRNYIIDNIKYNFKTKKIEYKEDYLIDIKSIIRELSSEFSDHIIIELNIEAFLRKLNQILELKKNNTKKKIKESFNDYYKSLNIRIKKIKEHKEKEEHFDIFEGEGSILGRKQYESEKYQLQVELLKLQDWVIKNNKKIAIVFEGRDAAGKGSTIKRFVEYLNPKGFKVVALDVPTEEEKNNWFQRYEQHLPKEGEIVFFDRSWHNRSVVEPSLGYCTEEQYQDFMSKVNQWEENLIKNEKIILIKLWFSITKDKQMQRFEIRKKSPLKYWKFSTNDNKVIDKWEIIGSFKKQMFYKNSTSLCPWVIINSNDKKVGRLNAMRYVISKIDYIDKNPEMGKYYPEIVNILI